MCARALISLCFSKTFVLQHDIVHARVRFLCYSTIYSAAARRRLCCRTRSVPWQENSFYRTIQFVLLLKRSCYSTTQFVLYLQHGVGCACVFCSSKRSLCQSTKFRALARTFYVLAQTLCSSTIVFVLWHKVSCQSTIQFVLLHEISCQDMIQFVIEDDFFQAAAQIRAHARKKSCQNRNTTFDPLGTPQQNAHMAHGRPGFNSWPIHITFVTILNCYRGVDSDPESDAVDGKSK